MARGSDESTRRQYLSHEASLKSIGLLYYLGAIILGIAAAGTLLVGIATLVNGEANREVGAVFFFVMVFVYSGCTVLYFFLARGIYRLENWARITIGVLSVPGLLGVPLGTLITVYFLYLCFSKKGAYICTDEYRRIVANTPQIKYKTSVIVWIFLGLLALVIVLGLIAIIIGVLSG